MYRKSLTYIFFVAVFYGNVAFAEKAVEVENYALYSQSYTSLPSDKIGSIGNPEKFSVEVLENGTRSHIYEWSDLKVTVNQMPAKLIPKHVKGFSAYINHLVPSEMSEAEENLVKRVLSTSMVLGVIVTPRVDSEGRAEDIIGAITYNTKSLMFYNNSIYNENAQLLLAPKN